MFGAAGQQRVHRIGGRESHDGTAWPAESLQDLLQYFVGSVGRPDVLGVQPVAKVAGQAFAQFGEFAVRVAVEPSGCRRHFFNNCTMNGFGQRMGVLVDVQLNWNINLGCTVWFKTLKILSQGQFCQAI